MAVALMTFVAARKGWMKKHLGKMHAVSCKQLGCRVDEAASMAAANAWWIAKEESLAADPKRDLAISQLGAMAGWFDRNGQGLEAAAMRSQAQAVAVADSVGTMDIPLRAMSETGRAVWADRLAKPVAGSVLTIGKAYEKFLGTLQLSHDAGEISAGRLVAYRAAVSRFADFLGRSNPVTDIDSARLWDFHQHLLGLVVAGQTVTKRTGSGVGRKQGLASATAATVLTSAKMFVAWLVERDLIDLPKALASKKLRVRKETKTPKTVSVAVVKKLLAGCGVKAEKTKLYLLLMLNCGMYQGDIAELKDSQVDWKAGTITRPRSKTPGGPVVTFTLWASTLQLLKENRSGGELVLLNDAGGALVAESMVANHYKRTDNIKSAYARLCKRLKLADAPTLKLLRKTSATVLAGHKDYKFYAQYFLAQSPRTVADKHYVVPSAEEFAKACQWLGQQYGC